MKLSAPPEKKVAYPAYFGLIASAAIQLTHVYAPSVKLPPVGVVVLLLTAVYALVGYFAPHTHVPAAPVLPTLIRLPSSVTEEQAAVFKEDIERVLKAAVQPPATGTGGAT